MHSIEAGQKSQVFEKTLIFFQKNNWYLRRENAERLSQYYQSENEQILKGYVSNTNTEKHVLTNVLWLISKLLEKEKTIDKKFWKQQIARLLKESTENLVISMALDASAQFKDLDLLKHNFHERFLTESDNDIIYEYRQACQVAAPNNAFTIDLLFSQYNFIRAPEPNFNKITSKEGIIYYLKKLAHTQNPGEFHRVIRKIEQYRVLEAVVENIKSVYNQTVEIAIGKLLLSSSYRHHYDYENGFGGLLLNLVIQTNPKFVYEIIDEEDSQKNPNFERVVAKFINNTNAEHILQKLLKLPNGKIVAFHTFRKFKAVRIKESEASLRDE